MMPINGTPILVHLMRIYADQGFTRFILAAGYRKEMLIDYFDGRFPDWQVDIVDTGEDVDTGERIARCAARAGGRFFATYGDGLGDIALSALLAEHERSGALATLTTVPLRSQYGLLVFDETTSRVQRFEEKPLIRDYWINAGFFVFDRDVFDFWEGANLERDVLPALARGRRLGVYKHEGFWKSMDTSKDQQEMENLCLNGSPPWKVLRPTAAEAFAE
jgi:glucose-1-phosphate cytidylyltransferase